MKDLNLEGLGRINGGEYDNITLEGVNSCSDHVKAENFHIEGVFTCSGQVEAGLLYCEGVSDFKANIRAKKIVVEGVFNGKDGMKIEAEELVCDGVIKSGGEIYADVVKADGCISAKEIYGDQIRIHTHYPINKIVKFFNTTKSDVRLIEATTIDISGVSADTLNGRDIIIGPNCRVGTVDCSGTLSIDSSSTVNTITGSYTRK